MKLNELNKLIKTMICNGDNVTKLDKYKLEIIPTDNEAKFNIIKTYYKGNVKTVNQFIVNRLFYRSFQQYTNCSIALIRDTYK